MKVKILCATLFFAVLVLHNCEASTIPEQETFVIINFIDRKLNELEEGCGGFPKTNSELEGLLLLGNNSCWSGPYLSKEALMDEWGKQLKYISPGIHNVDSFDLFSAGLDGEFNSVDDINNWNDEWRVHYKSSFWQNPIFYIAAGIFFVTIALVLLVNIFKKKKKK